MVCFSRKWAGGDSAWEQKKLEARKMLENAAESPASVHAVLGGMFGNSLPIRFCQEIYERSTRFAPTTPSRLP